MSVKRIGDLPVPPPPKSLTQREKEARCTRSGHTAFPGALVDGVYEYDCERCGEKLRIEYRAWTPRHEYSDR